MTHLLRNPGIEPPPLSISGPPQKIQVGKGQAKAMKGSSTPFCGIPYLYECSTTNALYIHTYIHTYIQYNTGNALMFYIMLSLMLAYLLLLSLED